MPTVDTFSGPTSAHTIVAAVEGVFRIRLSEKEWAEICTVRQLHQAVLAKLKLADQEGCLSSFVFYRLRAAMMRAWGTPREKIRRHTLLYAIMPPQHRRAFWCSLQHALGIELPKLRLTETMEARLLAMCTIGIIAIVVGIASNLAAWPIAAGFIILIGSLTFWSAANSSSLATTIPSKCETVEGLVMQIVSWNYGDLARRTGKWSEQEVYDALCTMIEPIFCAEPEMIQLDSKFSEFPDWD